VTTFNSGLRALVTGGTKELAPRRARFAGAAGVQVTTARSEPADPIDGVVYASADLQRLKAPPIVEVSAAALGHHRHLGQRARRLERARRWQHWTMRSGSMH
jgi:hypothetical protein